MRAASVDLDGPVHYVQFDGPCEGPTVVCVHGLGGSHLNWVQVGNVLAEHARVLAVDLAGFGRTPLAGRSASVHDNARLLARFVAETSDEPAVLVGNSMGGMVSLLTAATHPETVAGLVLVNPSLPLTPRGRIHPVVAANFAAYLVPRLGEWFVRSRRDRLGSEQLVHETLRLCCVDPRRVSEEALRTSIAFAEERAKQPWADEAFLEATRSLLQLNTAGRRRYLRAVEQVRAPTLLMHGRGDQLVPLSAARALSRRRPDWKLAILDGVGHLPQLEAPERFVAVVLQWLREGPGRQLLQQASA